MEDMAVGMADMVVVMADMVVADMEDMGDMVVTEDMVRSFFKFNYSYSLNIFLSLSQEDMEAVMEGKALK